VRLVTNASPLIFLAKIKLLPMLRSCFLQVLAPPAVVAETRLDLPGFIECRELSEIGHAFVRGAIGTLHRGEVEAIVLAREQGIALVAIDDKAARSRASEMGLRPIGTLGLIVLAQRLGHLDASTAMTKVDELVDIHGLYLSSHVRRQIRSQLGGSFTGTVKR
jgi:predicted nucleic acid-binding protein